MSSISVRAGLVVLIAVMMLPLAASARQSGPITASLKGVYGITTTNITKTAEMLDEGMYAYRPTEDVRSVGEMLGHIANAQYLICSIAAAEDSPASANHEDTAGNKAAIVSALEEAFAYCNGVFDRMSDADGSEMRNLFGNEMAASAVLAFGATHNYEHYGNLVTYMRMNGIVPPSSQQ